jgi:hypothetical protein
MVQVNLTKIFADTFNEDEGAAMALAKTLSRLSPEDREDAIIKLAMATGKNHVFWKAKLAALGSKKK